MTPQELNHPTMNDAPRPAVQVGTIHYQILGGVGLLLMVFAQVDEGIFPGNLLVGCVGLLGILSKSRFGPFLVLFFFAGVQFAFHRQRFGTFLHDDARPLLDVRDLLLAIGLLVYVAANYRLQSLWLQILPADARRRQREQTEGGRGQFVRVQHKRAARLLTPQEIARFVLTIPLAALAGQMLWLVIAQPWELAVFTPQFLRLVSLVWLFVVGLLIAGTILTHWRRRQMDRDAAQVYLQDTLWRETRREQRRIFRWLAWRRLHERTAEQSPP